MIKLTLDTITQLVATTVTTDRTTEDLSNIYKNVGTQASLHKPTSDEHKLLTTFQADVLKQIKSQRKQHETEAT